jgi:hypothetical protein
MIDYQRYLQNKRDERFCAGYAGTLHTGDGFSCGKFLGHQGDEGFAEKFEVSVVCPGCDECDGTSKTCALCAECQQVYRDQGLLA